MEYLKQVKIWNGIKGEFWIGDINFKDINMQEVIKARVLEEVTKEKRKSKD